MKIIKRLIILVVILSCSNNNPIEPSQNEEEFRFSKCNDHLNACKTPQNEDFCTFGFKWGDDNPFENKGPNVKGPSTSGGIITYEIIPEERLFNTHTQENINSLSIDSFSICNPRKQIRDALSAWEAIADITFAQNMNNAQTANIKFIVGNIHQVGIGYPNFTDDVCSSLAGSIIIDFPTSNTCDGLYNLFLHEIGHVLGLGHVNSPNLMNPSERSFLDLQAGDIEGIISIYGKK